jgi:hypothetical protein
MISETDMEIQVMATVYSELRRLNAHARERVLAWVLARIRSEQEPEGKAQNGGKLS